MWLRLLRSRRVGISTFYRLIAEYGSAESAVMALPGIAHKAGVNNYTPFTKAEARAEFDRARACGIIPVFIGSSSYPPMLATLPDAPPILWCKGKISCAHEPLIAIVGARNASSLGLRMARNLARDLGDRGFGIVSGLARGIDAAAHSSALQSGTVAVVAGGTDVVYPYENASLTAQIAASGLVVSEQPVGTVPQARHFPPRNRLISGMACAVIVVEAAAGSGSLITTRNALDQGREVLAVPGHPVDPRAAGCNQLIRDGARLVRHADDVIEALGVLQTVNPVVSPPSPPEPPPAPTGSLTPKRVLSCLSPTPITEDQLIRDLGYPAQIVSAILLDLEIDSLIIRHPGGMVSVNPA